jgi:tetratricopeptide (TPR) repeat protein
MGRLDKSMEVLQHAHSLAPKDLDISRELGIVYFLSGRVDQAIENLKAIRSTPGTGQNDDLLSLYYLGRGYQEKGDFGNALPLFLKVQKKMPEFVDVYYNLGSVYGRMGQKGLSHLYFGKHFKLRGEKNNALLHLRTAFEWLERGSQEREEAQREIKELTSPK